MRIAAARAALDEARGVRAALVGDQAAASGALVVSGMLAEQLARELGRGAESGAVRVGAAGPLREGDLAVHVVAGDPSAEDVALVRSASRIGVPVVLVQLWPQPDWTPPFVLSPFVVECRPGEGFPVEEIAARIADAGGSDPTLPGRVPALTSAFERVAVREAVGRAALLGALGGRGGAARPLLTLEQARLLGRLGVLPAGSRAAGIEPALVGTVAALETSGLALRGLARRARAVLPSRLANAAIAAGGTWAIAAAAKAARARRARE